MQLVECVPNFSEGRDLRTIEAIAGAIVRVSGVHLLDVDANESANRTVMTFAGEANAVSQAAFAAIETAKAMIDMRAQTGAHPRIGATDVCPLVPLSGCTMADCVAQSMELAERVGRELKIPVYLYSHSARQSDRRHLAFIRKGQYEGLAARMQAGFTPDEGPSEFDAQAGATVIGARHLLIAFNVNLATQSEEIAQKIAAQIRRDRQSLLKVGGRSLEEGEARALKPLSDCTAIGWYLEQFKRAQVSLNLMDYEKTSIYQAFLEVSRLAKVHGTQVTGSEIVGLVPLPPMLEAGQCQLESLHLNENFDQRRLLDAAIEFLNLSELREFSAAHKILDYRLDELALPFNN
jgi:glutamate formiminotransferase/formiminotetrahydrofolate cyclodeaminase